MAEGFALACECRRGASLGRLGTPGDVGTLTVALGFRWSGRDEELVKPSWFTTIARECLCAARLEPSVRGVVGCVCAELTPSDLFDFRGCPS
jgi:hypothetical protein